MSASDSTMSYIGEDNDILYNDSKLVKLNAAEKKEQLTKTHHQV